MLRHFADAQCPLTPRFLGHTADGAERLTYIEGVTGYPPLSEDIRSDDALVNVARAIRTVHDAADDFSWSTRPHTYDAAVPDEIDCIGHHDLTPWNVVFEGTQVRGIIDWDSAGPSNRVWDLAYAAYQFVPFHPTADLPAWGWTDEPDRRRRLHLFAESYRTTISPARLVDAAILRVCSIGTFLAREAERGNAAFAVEARENHARGYFRGASSLIGMRESLLS